MDAIGKRIHYASFQTGPECHYCGAPVLNPAEGKFCTHCGAANRHYDAATQEEGFGSDCENDHGSLKLAVKTGGQLCVEAPFCEDCGFCALPVTWREHKRSRDRDITSYELVKDNKQVAYAYFWLTERGLLDPNRMTLNRQDMAVTFDELYEHIEHTPNLPDDARELLMASKDRWDVHPGDQTVIILKQ